MGLWVLALSHSGGYETGGYVDLKSVLRIAGRRWRAASDRLVKVGLWEAVEGGFKFHDHGDYNHTCEELSLLRSARAEAGRRGGIAKYVASAKQVLSKRQASAKQVSSKSVAGSGSGSGSVSGSVSGSEAFRSDPGEPEEASGKPDLEVGSQPSDSIKAHTDEPAVASTSFKAPDSPVERVFNVYRSYHPRSALDARKRDLVRLALRSHTEDTCIAAIHGNHVDSYCCGQNDRGQEYHALSLILRDDDHIVRYAEALERRRRGVIPIHPKTQRTVDALRTMQELRDLKERKGANNG